MHIAEGENDLVLVAAQLEGIEQEKETDDSSKRDKRINFKQRRHLSRNNYYTASCKHIHTHRVEMCVQLDYWVPPYALLAPTFF